MKREAKNKPLEIKKQLKEMSKERQRLNKAILLQIENIDIDILPADAQLKLLNSEVLSSEFILNVLLSVRLDEVREGCWGEFNTALAYHKLSVAYKREAEAEEKVLQLRSEAAKRAFPETIKILNSSYKSWALNAWLWDYLNQNRKIKCRRSQLSPRLLRKKLQRHQISLGNL